MRRIGATRPVALLMLCGAFLIAIVVCTIALILSNLRDHALAESKQQLLATATVLGQQAARDFEAVDLIEANLIEHMQILAVVSDEVYARSMASHDIKLMLEDKIGGFPYIEAVMLIGSDGTVINSSVAWPTPECRRSGLFSGPQGHPGLELEARSTGERSAHRDMDSPSRQEIHGR